MPLSPGARLGPYEIVAPLGAGGMGAVYRARDGKLQRDVALKVLPDDVAADAERLSRFEREARTLAALNHPQIAAIYGFEDSTGTPALVMELVEGEDLAERMARGAIPLADALRIASQIADALDAAHERGIVHRDLKPANIKLRRDGTIKVLDFGLAKMFGPAESDAGTRELATSRLANSPTITSPAALTNAGVLLGTAAYMSPEQARGQAIDARTDLWAFGCVLFEMLTGARAFAGDTVTHARSGGEGRAPMGRPSRRNSAGDRETASSLPHKRTQTPVASASDARLEIEDALDSARTDPAATVPSGSRRSRLNLGLGAATALAAIAGAFFLGSRAVTVPATLAPVTRFVIPAPPGTQIVSGHREIAVSPDGQQVAFIARGPDGQHIFVRRLDALDSHQVPGTEGARDLTFSPDGRWLAFHAGNKIRKVNTAAGVPTILADAVHSHGLAWHPASDEIYFTASQTGVIWKVPARSGVAAVAVTSLDKARGERSHEWPVLSMDGRTLLSSVNAVTANFDDEEVSLLDIDSGRRQTVRTGGDAVALTDNRELLFVRDRFLMSALYDATRSELGSEPRELIEGVRNTTSGAGMAIFERRHAGIRAVTGCQPTNAGVDLTGWSANTCEFRPSWISEHCSDRGRFTDCRHR